MLHRDKLKEAWDQAVAHHLEGHGEPVSRETPLSGEYFKAPPPQKVWEHLEQYGSHVLEANQRINLVSRRNPENQILKNILDGILLGVALGGVSRETRDPWLLVDAGSGSGVPGIPARFYLGDPPEGPRLLLVDSQRKKQDFLEGLLPRMGLEESSIFRGRLESPHLLDLCAAQHSDASWVLCSKAFAGTKQTLAWVSHLQPKLERAFLMKGPSWSDEVPDHGPVEPGWQLAEAHRFQFTNRTSIILELHKA